MLWSPPGYYAYVSKYLLQLLLLYLSRFFRYPNFCFSLGYCDEGLVSRHQLVESYEARVQPNIIAASALDIKGSYNFSI